MSESLFLNQEEEYTAASWLTTLQTMQRGADLLPKASISGRVCAAVAKEPEELLTTFRQMIASANTGNTSGRRFFEGIGALDVDGKLTQGLSDAALLLCSDPLAMYVKEKTSFSRLIPIIDELCDYCTEKHFADASGEGLKMVPGEIRFSAIRVESDFYLREYDR